MKNIKFRGKRVDTGEWAYGWLYCHSGKYFIMCNDNEEQIDPKTVGQYIFTNKMLDVYEGDIFQFGTEKAEFTFGEYRKVSYGHGDCTETLFIGYKVESWGKDNDLVYLGNKFDNPELIK